MTYEDFLRIVEYGNKHWKGSFTKNEVEQNAKDYFAEYLRSNEQGKPTRVIEELCKLLIDDVYEGNSKEAEEFLDELMLGSEWIVETFICQHCGKREIVTFSQKEIEGILKHENRQMLIQDALPTKPQWIREVYISGMCKCPKCWQKYFNGEM